MGNKKKTSRFTNILILVTILVLPGFLYYLLEKHGRNTYITLPVFGEKTLTGTFTSKMGERIPDTLFHEISPFTLVNQQGRQVHALSDDSTISVTNFFHTRCQTFCTHMNNEMNRVAERFVNNNKVRFYTITVDTLYDTPEVLQAYAAHYTPESKKWHFLTAGGGSDVFDISRSGYLLDAVAQPGNDSTFVHASSLVLVDSKRRIRGYYDVTHRKEVDRLIDEIKLLLVEEIRSISPY